LQASEQILETARESELSGLKNHMSMIMELARKYSAYVSVLLRDPSSNQFSRKLREMIWPVLRPYVIQHPCTEQEESLLEEFYLCG
ncbi:TetR/AcrR family transcriptional regulator, partial [Veillonella atypica]|nr:TetR/AcrR family transcriptional regulator [Veillonella atypica]